MCIGNILIFVSVSIAFDILDLELSILFKIVVINNAWKILEDWTDHIYPHDFPDKNKPSMLKSSQQKVEERQFVNIQNQYGGFVYAGGTMAFTALYWVLGHYKAEAIDILGCDMVYPKTGSTHFYGTGTPDPLREDISLRSLKAKSARAYAIALEQGCQISNLSKSESELIAPRKKSTVSPTPQPFKLDKNMLIKAKKKKQALGN